MSLISFFHGKNIRKKYVSKLKELLKEYDHYVYALYEKVTKIAEIKNKAFDIQNHNKGFIAEDEKKFGIFENKKAYFYYKGWVNRRLKRINRIMRLQIKSGYKMEKEDRNILATLRELREVIEENESDRFKEELDRIIELEKNVRKQWDYVEKIYPLKEWTLELHQSIFPQEIIKAVAGEIELILGKRINDRNYNTFPAVVSKALHEHDLPDESYLKELINNNISIIKQRKRSDSLSQVKCYHAKPIYARGSIFPLHSKEKSLGFFVDTDKRECLSSISKIYNAQIREIDLYELEIPQNLFRYARQDTMDGMIFPLKHSYVFKPSLFPLLNEFYQKGLIRIRRICP